MSRLSLDRAGARRLAVANGMARSALGVVAFCLPGLPLAPWVGGSSRDQSSRLLGRALGGRDLALGLGTLVAARSAGPARPWVVAGGLADAGDVVATLLAWRSLPPLGRSAVLAAAAGGVLAAAAAAGSVDAASG